MYLEILGYMQKIHLFNFITWIINFYRIEYMDIIYWYVVAILVALVPIYLIKKFVITSNENYLLLTMLLYAILIISYVKIFQQEPVASAYVILQILQIIVVVLMGVLLFDDKVTFNKIIGLCFGIISVYLLV